MKRKSDFILRNVGNENMLIPLGAKVMDLNGILTLNETAACLWELLAKDRTVEELSQDLAKIYKVDSITAFSDVEVFLQEINEIGLLDQ